MKKLAVPAAVAALLFCGPFAMVNAQPYPMLDKVVQKVIQKYQTSTCKQLAADKKSPPSDVEKRVIDMMRKDPQLRQAFLDQVAGPITIKLFECGMIP